MPEQLRTARELLDRGFTNVSPTARAFDLSLEVMDEPELTAGPGLVTAIRDVATAIDRGELGGLIDALISAGSDQAVANAMISAKYQELGGASGVLGSTAGGVTVCPDGVGWFRHFQRGSIYWHPNTGAHEVHGLIRERWAELGWERSFLGYPTSDETVGRDPAQAGRFNHFEGGSLYWHPPEEPLASVAVHTAVLSGMLLADAEPAEAPPTLTAAVLTAGSFAAARERAVNVSAVARTAGSEAALRAETTASGEFNARVPDVRPDLRAEIVADFPRRQTVFEVHGAIRARYLALGAEASVLGYPVTDETGTPDGIGRFNHFQAGSIYWTPSTGAHEVHGLIRALWSAAGWERDPSLGYPITDELIPDRRVGSRRAESLRKPVIGLAADVVKLPSTAIMAGVTPSVVNLPRRLDVARLDAASRTGLVDVGVVTHVGGLIGGLQSAGGGVTTAAAEVSPNRFSDFENGVAFWERGATSAHRLAPWRPGGGSGPTMPAAEVVQAASDRLRPPLASGTPGLQSVTFAGTTGYRHDGAGTHNRAHRLTVRLNGGPMLSVEAIVAFDPVARTVTLAIATWAAQAGVSVDLARSLHRVLDPLLWMPNVLIDLSDAGGEDPAAVLSVKTQSSGDVAVYIEPARSRPGAVVLDSIRVPLITAAGLAVRTDVD